MEILETLRDYGLFDAKVPRYTSYPPANRFLPDQGRTHKAHWMSQIPENSDISVYVHIPFCRRLCWFCACRTQGTKSLSPVAAYIETVVKEIKTTADLLPNGVRIARLHLGGGTPTLLNRSQMDLLLSTIHNALRPADCFEFSVEIDPTEADDDILSCLVDWGLKRGSIGVQDFNTRVQDAIGRRQSLDETQRVVDILQSRGVTSLNFDLLYGLPHQNSATLEDTLQHVIALMPDRIALYGYAHVPHMSKRQIMIPNEALPSATARYRLAQLAKDKLVASGYQSLGIDHYALDHDSLAKAARSGRMYRNFQGYTDDPCNVLLGFGASAISSFPQGYSQNAVSTGAYIERISETGQAAHKGIALTDMDHLVGAMISGLMCQGRVALRDVPGSLKAAKKMAGKLVTTFPKAVTCDGSELTIRAGYFDLARILCAHLDQTKLSGRAVHSAAV